MIKELKQIAGIARWLEQEPELVVVYDENVAWVATEVLKALPQAKASIALETSEELKTMDTVLALERRLLEAGLSRGAMLLAIGGGITTDLTGFAASMYKRGIRYANFPTTLLAQVDAAIGGKTGVNLDGYKNMLGAFRMPEYTFLCADVLRTLPPRAFRCGVAELLKTFLLADAAAYESAVRLLSGAKRPKTPPNCSNSFFGRRKSRPALWSGTRRSTANAPSLTWATPSVTPSSTRPISAAKISSTARRWPSALSWRRK